MNVSIRPYKSSDEAQVRRVCCDTADKGEPIEGIFPDRAIAADLLTGYYLHYEPQACFVAEAGGEIAGYILSSIDNRRYGLVMVFILIPQVILKGFKNGLFFKKDFWVFLKGMVKNWRRLFSWRKESFHSHQAHMHIGVDSQYRGQGVGHRLIQALLDYGKKQKVTEITASVHNGNVAACHFFERLGFVVRQQYPMVATGGDLIETYQSLLYVKQIS